MSRRPVSTYRLQLTEEFTFARAQEQLPYLRALGVDAIYLSPVLEATPGSQHGYDVVAHDRIDAARGGRDGFDALCRAAREAGLAVLVDIVPNHVGIDGAKPGSWWWDVLRHGRDSVHAKAFDVDWAAGPILLPILGDGPVELERVTVHGAGDEAVLRYWDHEFPVAPGTGDGEVGEVLERQHYQLVSWRRGDAELRHRRFFTVTTLAGIRVEDREVFDASHVEIKRWCDEDLVDGLRIDHPDGLVDPAGYLQDLADIAGDRWVLVEKILGHGERLPADWRADGTTGYEALGVVERVLIDSAGEQPLTDLDTELRGGAEIDWWTFTRAAKLEVAATGLQAEVQRLVRLVPDLAEAAQVLVALLVEFDVYRSHLPVGRAALDRAVQRALTRRPELADGLRSVRDRLLAGGEFAGRFEQTGSALMAKGVEDRAGYRWPRLTSLAEVGSELDQFSLTVAQFHAAQQDRLAAEPAAMTALTTHDTKRSEDVRARIDVLAERPQWWAEQVRRLQLLAPLPDPVLANLVWQAVVGAWPLSAERAVDYALKAAREAAVVTTWTDQDAEVEDTIREALSRLDEDLQEVLDDIAGEITSAGWSNSLSAKLLQLAGPGVPDVYQGSERAAFGLVDPDNRRPIDYAALAEALARIDAGDRPGAERPADRKLQLTATVLRLRRDRPDLFAGYRPLPVDGPAADHLIAFDRGGVLALATRLPVGLAASGGWRDSSLTLPPGTWGNALTGTGGFAGVVPISVLLGDHCVAVLVRSDLDQEESR